MQTRLSDKEYVKDSLKAFLVCIVTASMLGFLPLIHPLLGVINIFIGWHIGGYVHKKWPDILLPI